VRPTDTDWPTAFDEGPASVTLACELEQAEERLSSGTAAGRARGLHVGTADPDC
jgi:hypothetical protein